MISRTTFGFVFISGFLAAFVVEAWILNSKVDRLAAQLAKQEELNAGHNAELHLLHDQVMFLAKRIDPGQ